MPIAEGNALSLNHCPYLDRVRADVRHLAELAFREDLPDGDVTAQVLGLKASRAEADLICREPVSVCGVAWFEALLEAHMQVTGATDLNMVALVEDGQRVAAGNTLLKLQGNTAAILSMERTLLNFLGRGIGIANATFSYVEVVRKHNHRTRILDTRKTLPGYRHFDKYAVLCGGGANHRMNLSDQVLIKENHIAKLNGIPAAMQHLRRHLDRDVGIQIEVRNFEELQQAIDVGFPIIMLDNFTPEQVARACELDRGDSQLEVSGGINLETIEAYCHPRLDRISIGALTHSVKAPDLSLLISEVQ